MGKTILTRLSGSPAHNHTNTKVKSHLSDLDTQIQTYTHMLHSHVRIDPSMYVHLYDCTPIRISKNMSPYVVHDCTHKTLSPPTSLMQPSLPRCAAYAWSNPVNAPRSSQQWHQPDSHSNSYPRIQLKAPHAASLSSGWCSAHLQRLCGCELRHSPLGMATLF